MRLVFFLDRRAGHKYPYRSIKTMIPAPVKKTIDRCSDLLDISESDFLKNATVKALPDFVAAAKAVSEGMNLKQNTLDDAPDSRPMKKGKSRFAQANTKI